MSTVAASDSLRSAALPSTASAWAWHAPDGGARWAASPFLSQPAHHDGAPQAAQGASAADDPPEIPSSPSDLVDDGHSLPTYSFPAPVAHAHFDSGAPNSQGNSSSQQSSNAGREVPRPAKSPIGPMSLAVPRPTVAPSADLSGLKRLDAYATGGGGVHTLILTDDAALDPKKESDDGGYRSSYHSANLPSLTASPMSTSAFAHEQLSPSSPSHSFHSSLSPSSHSLAPSRGEDSIDALDKSLTAMFLHSTSHPPSQPQSASFGPQQPQQHAHSQTSSAHATPYSAPLTASSPPPPSAVAPLRDNSGSAAPAGTQYSPSGGVAYVVLPNGQVQTVDVAAIQQALSGGSPAAFATAQSLSSMQRQQQQQQQQHPSSSSSNSSQSQGNTPSLAPVFGRMESRGAPPVPHSTPHYNINYPNSPPTDGAGHFNDGGNGAGGNVVADDVSFSLETLSTKTLPLFSPPTPPPQVSSMGAPQSNHGGGYNMSQLPSGAPSAHRPASLGPYSSQQSSRGGPHGHPGHSSQSPYSSPQGGSMQQRRGHNAQQQTGGSRIVPHISDYPPHAGYNQSPTPSPPGSAPMLHITHAGGGAGEGNSRDLVRNLGPAQTLSSHKQAPGGQSYSPHLHAGATSDSLVAQAKSQAGSRALQTKIAANDPVYFARVFDEVYDSLPELSTDLFGNYLVQKLISFASEQQRMQMLLKMLPELLEISCDRQGTRAIQKLIESLTAQHERQLVLDWLTLPMPGGHYQHTPAQQQQQQPTMQEAMSPPAGLSIQASPATSPQPLNPTSVSSPNSPLMSPPLSNSTSVGSTSSTSSTSATPSAPPSPSSAFAHTPMPRLIHLIRDQNGSHVVHSILDTFPQPLLTNIQRNVMKNCRTLGIDQHGLCILKKVLSMAPAADFIYFNLKMTLEFIHEFVNNQYGNYLVQHVIERTNGLHHATNQASRSEGHSSAVSAQALAAVSEADDQVRPQMLVINDAIFRSLRGNFSRLSRQKFSSNVVEKVLKIPDAGIRSAVVAELIEPDSIASLLLCSYGNYVLQNVLYVATQEECALLMARVRPEHVLASLRKNIRAKWERLLANAHLIHPGLAPGGIPLSHDGNGMQQNSPPQSLAHLSVSAPSTPMMPVTPTSGMNADMLMATSPSAASLDVAHSQSHLTPQQLSTPLGVSPQSSPTPSLGAPTTPNVPIVPVAGSSVPSQAAIQLIANILGSNAAAAAAGRDTLGMEFAASPTGSERGGTPNPAQSPSNSSPSMRSIAPVNVGGSASSPSMSSRQFARGTSQSNSYQRQAMGMGDPRSATERRPSHSAVHAYPSGTASNTASPYMSAAATPDNRAPHSHRQQLLNYNASVAVLAGNTPGGTGGGNSNPGSGAQSPTSHHRSGLAHTAMQQHGGYPSGSPGGHYGSGGGVQGNPSSSPPLEFLPSHGHGAHPRGPPSAHHVVTGGGNGPKLNISTAGPLSVPVPSGGSAPMSPEALQQQIANAQQQLQALMALQAQAQAQAQAQSTHNSQHF